MKTALLISALAVFALVAGCSKKEEPAVPDSGYPQPKTSAAASLGTEVPGEHFSVTLSADPAEPKAGKSTFTALVSHHGSPTENAHVTLKVGMPSMSAHDQELEMKHEGGGKYVAIADLAMAGEWQAVVKVDEEGHPGEATYRFEVKE